VVIFIDSNISITMSMSPLTKHEDETKHTALRTLTFNKNMTTTQKTDLGLWSMLGENITQIPKSCAKMDLDTFYPVVDISCSTVISTPIYPDDDIGDSAVIATKLAGLHRHKIPLRQYPKECRGGANSILEVTKSGTC
jgi:hypothetical protein